ncbi:receptor-type tyrosine-protein phosphatase T-like isoform X2 [Limulus polyphemus]|nr:receptor-type tyrosine-protein phosphatase T-like isoform X2 [Limulus polyphemus]XP_022247398.1 receptor-type tyrosine-protein phosphatase T-like isoform X2 [Limulus polyphemus]
MEKEPSDNLEILNAEIPGFEKLKHSKKGPLSALEIHQCESPPGAEKQHLIKLEDLEKYVKTMTENEGFTEQYNMLKTGQLKDWTVGMKPENKNKNRYSTLLPYDETRVVLNPLKNDPHSDYINANYIDGYNTSKAYICTQGPLEKTVVDFWRLIWQEEICKIVMTCNVIEHCKKKCEKYWPDTTDKYGDISVTLLSQKEFVDYTIRTFKVQKSSVGRQVRQFHFTAWPDHGVPSYPLSLIKVLKLAKNYCPSSKASILLHCSAGVGRTGTLVLFDSAIQMVKSEGKVDVFGLLYKLREQRVNLVETVEQYAFVHRALIEVLFGDKPSRSAEELPLYFKKLTNVDCQTEKTGLQAQFERLEIETAKFREDRANPNTITERKTRNRVVDLLTFDCGKPVVFSNTSTNHLNTVYVHGYGEKEAIITTECPSPFTTKDFWQLVHESGCQTLVLLDEVSLSDKCCSTFWPESGSQYYGNLKVDHVGTEQTKHLIIRNLKLKNPVEDQKSRSIKLFHLSGWQKEDTIPPSVDSIITLLQIVDRWQHKTRSKPTIVVCTDGVSASGVFCAVSFLFRQKQQEKEIDVFEAVRTIRINEPHFIRSVDQYRWVYEVACGLGRFKTPSD